MKVFVITFSSGFCHKVYAHDKAEALLKVQEEGFLAWTSVISVKFGHHIV